MPLSHGFNEVFDGEIDEVRFWHSARTPEQLVAFSNQELNGTEPDLVAYYPMNLEGGLLDDLVGENAGSPYDTNDGIITGAIQSGNVPTVSPASTLDITSPTVTVSSTESGTTSLSPFPVTFTFSEFVVGFEASDISAPGAIVSNLSTADNIVWTADITPLAEGAINVDVANGSVHDLTGNALSGSTAFNITFDAPENALTFDGLNDFVDISDVDKITNPAVQDYTISMWFSSEDPSGGDYLLSYSHSLSGNEPFSSLTVNNTINFSRRNTAGGESLTLTGPEIIANEWYHVAITKSGNTFTLYLNGAQVATGSATSTGVFDRTRVLIGAYSGADSGNNQIDRYFDGSIDELKIWNDTRTVAEIQADRYEKYPSADDNLEAYYNFDHSGGNLLIDSSPNAFHGTLFGEFGITQSSTSNTVTSEPNAAQGASLSSLSTDETVGSKIRNMNDESAAYREDYIVTANTSNTFTITPNWSVNPVNPGGFAISYNNPVFGMSGAFSPALYQVTNASNTGFEANWLSLPEGVTLRFELDDANDFASLIATVDAVDPTANFEFFNQSLTSGQKYYLRAYYIDGTFTSPFSETVEFMVVPGNALEFDGDNDQIDLAASEDFAFGTGDFTIELWANLENESSYMHFFVHGADQNDFSFKTRPSDQVIYIYGSSGAFNSSVEAGSSGLYSPNQWSHIALVRRAGVAEFYIDGSLAYTYSDPDFANYSFVNNKTSIIGWGFNAEYTHGSYDEYRIWNYARTQTEIQDNLYNTLTGNETGLATYYRFDEGDAGVDNSTIANADAIKDLTGNGNDGDLNGFAKTGTNSNWITSTALQSGAAPAAPTDLIAYRISDTEVQLEWSDNASDNVDYLIEWDDATDFSSVVGNQVAGGNVTSAIVNIGVDQGYFFRVTARNATGDGVSATDFATTNAFPGQALSFDGVNDYVQIPDNDDLSFGDGVSDSPMTVEAWVYMDQITSRCIVSKRAGVDEWHIVISSDSRVSITLADASTGGFIFGES